MKLTKTTRDGKPAYKYGSSGKAFKYTPGNKKSRNKTKRRAYKAGRRSKRR